jgi:hypothetical protein
MIHMVWVLEWAAGCGEGVLQLRQSAVNPLVGAEESCWQYVYHRYTCYDTYGLGIGVGSRLWRRGAAA